jgi:hypothetical protein
MADIEATIEKVTENSYRAEISLNTRKETLSFVSIDLTAFLTRLAEIFVSPTILPILESGRSKGTDEDVVTFNYKGLSKSEKGEFRALCESINGRLVG